MNNKNEKEILIQVGEQAIVQFIDMSFEGLGVCKINGIDLKGTYYENFPIFVEGALPSEKGIIELTKLNKKYANGKIIKLFSDTPSSIYRVRPICENYQTCGGCNIMHMNYEGQLEFKHKVVSDAIKRIANLPDVSVEKVIGMAKPLYYRNKVQMPFMSKGNRKSVVGFYMRDSHEVMPISRCYIQSEKSCEIANFIKNILNEFQIRGYDEKYHNGTIRHITIKISQTTSEIMIVLVSMTPELMYQEQLIKKIIMRYPLVKSIVLNVNNVRDTTVMTEDNIVLYGQNYIEDTLCGLKFRIGASSFFQVNNVQTEILYNKILECGFKDTDVVIDAFCGIGTIALIVAQHVKKVYGVEIVEEAINNAKENAEINKITNVSFVVGKAEEIVSKWANEANTIILDPPRKGCEIELLQTIIDTKIAKVIYVSCNPTTLARDLRILVDNDYQVELVQPVDMFPQTSHVETIVLLSYKNHMKV